MFIKGIGLGLPREKVVLGPEFLKDKTYFEKEKQVSFFRADRNDTPFTLACRAVEDALRKCGIRAMDLDAVIFADSLIKDYQQWSLSAALCNHFKISKKMFLDVYHGCNLLPTIELAKFVLDSNKSFKNIIVVTSRVLPPALGNLEDVDRGAVLSDGACAVILSREAGSYEVLSLVIDYEAELCGLYNLPYGGTELLKDFRGIPKWDIAKLKDEFAGGRANFDDFFFVPKKKNIADGLAKAHVKTKDISWLVMPNYCRYYLSASLESFPHIPSERTSADTGMKFSHMGAGDVLINLSDMDPHIAPGDLVFVNPDGVGFTFGSMVLRKIC